MSLHPPEPEKCVPGDYLAVYPSAGDGVVNENSTLAGRLCGSQTLSLYSAGPGLVLEFHTEENLVNSTGFSGTFSFINAEGYRTEGERVPGSDCDFVFTRSSATGGVGGRNGSSGLFYSPSYPSSYPRKSRCAYVFRARPKERIKIIFEELDFQKGDISCLDREDVVKVHDGDSSLSPVIGVLCNQVSRAELISSSHQLFIELATSSFWPGHGFVASYHFLTLEARTEEGDPRTIEGVGPAVSATRSSWEKTIRSEYHRSGAVTSPGYPGPNQSGQSCKFVLSGTGKERVRLRVTHYTPGKAGRCEVRLYNPVEGRREGVPVPCSQPAPWAPIMSNGHRLELEVDNASGVFRAEYAFLNNYGIRTGRQLAEYPCAFRYSAEDFLSGFFHSPNFPGPYPPTTECHYFFHGLRGHRIRMHFSYFDIEGKDPCTEDTKSDYVKFFNFPDRLSKRYCGQLEPFDVLLERRFLRVTFRSTGRRGRGTGFNATYQFLGYPRPAHRGLLPVPASPSLAACFKAFTSLIFFTVMCSRIKV